MLILYTDIKYERSVNWMLKDCYVINQWIFTKSKVDSDGNYYYNITHPDGRRWDNNHLFKSYEDMVEYVKNQKG